MFFIEDKETPVVLLSAGIGVTPVLSMLEHIAAKTPDRPVVFIHCNRDVEHVALKNDIHAAMVALKNGKAYMFLSAPPQGPGCPCMKAGPSRPEKLVAFNLDKASDVYMCGPVGFMDGHEEGARRRRLCKRPGARRNLRYTQRSTVSISSFFDCRLFFRAMAPAAVDGVRAKFLG